MTAEERRLVMQYYNTTRRSRVGIPVASLLIGVLYYALPVALSDLIVVEAFTFMFFLLAIMFAIGTISVARNALRIRRGAAVGRVRELSGPTVKLGQAIAARGVGSRGTASRFRLQVGASQVLVPLSVYDRFEPQGEGRLTYLEGADLALAVNGVALPVPEEIRQSRGGTR